MSEQPGSRRPERASLAARVGAALLVAALLVAGVFVFGRVADDMGVAMLLTGAWFAAVVAGGYIFTRRRGGLRLPMAIAFAVVALATGLLVGLPSLTDHEVNERVVTASPRARPPEGDRPARARNVELARGAFASLAHPGRGKASVVRLARGERRLTLTGFETDSGPDLRVYLAVGDGRGDLGDFVDLGGLKGNKGNQQYAIPKDVDLRRLSNVVIWCRAFSVGFTSAPLERRA